MFNDMIQKRITTNHYIDFLRQCSLALHVFLAAQILSNNMIGIVKKYGKEGGQPIVELLSNCDRFIDIMNARQEKGCYNINGPRHNKIIAGLELLLYQYFCRLNAQRHSSCRRRRDITMCDCSCSTSLTNVSIVTIKTLAAS